MDGLDREPLTRAKGPSEREWLEGLRQEDREMAEAEFDIEAAENLATHLENLNAAGEALYEIDPEICADTIRLAIKRIRELEGDR